MSVWNPSLERVISDALSFYLLDYEPLVPPPKDHDFDDHESTLTGRNSSSDSSDTMSIRTAPVQYGHVYGTSAVSAFGEFYRRDDPARSFYSFLLYMFLRSRSYSLFIMLGPHGPTRHSRVYLPFPTAYPTALNATS